MEEKNISELIEQAKQSTSTPLQSVRPIKNSCSTTNELQIAFYLPKSLYKKVKTVALEQEVSIKSILNQSIENYINDIS